MTKLFCARKEKLLVTYGVSWNWYERNIILGKLSSE
jgi:hypothetical protein